MRKFVPTILSFLFITVLAIYISNFREGNPGNPLPVTIFWSCLISIIILISYQISVIKSDNTKNYVIIILQILLLAVLIRLLMISNSNALIGYDSYGEYTLLFRINNLQHWTPNIVPSEESAYPLLYFLGIEWAKISNLSLLTVAKWMPLLISFIAPLIVYLIATLKYSRKTGLLAILGFSFLYISLFFHTGLQREDIALPMMLIAIYFYLKSINIEESIHRTVYIILTIFMLIAITLSHHLVGFILLIFFVIWLLINQITEVHKFINIKIDNKLIKKMSFFIKKGYVSTTFIFLIISLLFGYWLYLSYSPIGFLTSIIKESAIVDSSAGIGPGVVVPNQIRYTILYWGDIIFTAIFALLGFIGLFLKRKNLDSFNITLFIFSGIMGTLMLLTVLGFISSSEGMGLGSRFETFIYIGLILLFAYTVSVFIDQNRELAKKIVIALLVIFIIFNVYRIPPYLYSDVGVFHAGDPRPIITEQELDAVMWLGRGSDDVVSDNSFRGALKLAKYINNPESNVLINFKYIIFSKLTPIETNEENNITKTGTKIYDNNISSIFIQPKII